MEHESLLEKVHKQYRILTELLIEKKLTVSTMESCTGGLIASLITDTLGASAVLQGSICAYSNEVKMTFGVSSDVIEKYGVYSEETAVAMAKTIQAKLSSDFAVGVTGSLCSTDTMNIGSIPGEVYLAVSGIENVTTKRIEVIPGISRFESKLFVAQEAGAMLEEMIRQTKRHK